MVKYDVINHMELIVMRSLDKTVLTHHLLAALTVVLKNPLIQIKFIDLIFRRNPYLIGYLVDV